MDTLWSTANAQTLTLGVIAIRFTLAFLFGGCVGLERRWRQQVAGLRTHLLVCIGAASTMMVSEYSYMYVYMGQSADPFRISAQVISGIGFLGAGTIIMTSRHQIKGLTTAASLWSTACMGLCLGIGFYECAVVMFAFLLLVLIVMSRFDEKYLKIPADTSIYLEMDRSVGYGLVIQHVKARGWSVRDIREMRQVNPDTMAVKFDLSSDTEGSKFPLELDILREREGIHCAEELYNES